jgi:hypothetical protein
LTIAGSGANAVGVGCAGRAIATRSKQGRDAHPRKYPREGANQPKPIKTPASTPTKSSPMRFPSPGSRLALVTRTNSALVIHLLRKSVKRPLSAQSSGPCLDRRIRSGSRPVSGLPQKANRESKHGRFGPLQAPSATRAFEGPLCTTKRCRSPAYGPLGQFPSTAPVSHQKRRERNGTKATGIEQNRGKINEADQYSPAHNGQVAGSSLRRSARSNSATFLTIAIFRRSAQTARKRPRRHSRRAR